VKLSVRERLIILTILPQEGDAVTLRVLRKLQENLSFTEEEHQLYKFVQKDTTVTWDDTVEQEKDIEIGGKGRELIGTALAKLNDQKKLRMEHLDIYERFVEKD